jgi:hypothetical protein
MQGRVPRVSRLLAVAHHLQGMLERGEVKGMADIGRLDCFASARVTQIMNPLLLAPANRMPQAIRTSQPAPEPVCALIGTVHYEEGLAGLLKSYWRAAARSPLRHAQRREAYRESGKFCLPH